MSTPNGGSVTYNTELRAERYSYGTVLTYSCNNGYYKSTGSNQRTCQTTGQWDGSPALCKKGKERLIFLQSAKYLYAVC